jgi:hypothetical protein
MRTAKKFRLLLVAFVLGASLSASQANAWERQCSYDGNWICCYSIDSSMDGYSSGDEWAPPECVQFQVPIIM